MKGERLPSSATSTCDTLARAGPLYLETPASSLDDRPVPGALATRAL
jgi:hypothetical protein